MKNLERLNEGNNVRMTFVEVRMGETDKEAWLRHLAERPADRDADVWVFNRPWM